MKLRTLVVVGLMFSCAAYADAPEQAAVQKSQEAMKEFGMTLKATLQAAMKEGGVMNAIPVCHTEAPKIAQQMSEKYGVDIHLSLIHISEPTRPY